MLVKQFNSMAVVAACLAAVLSGANRVKANSIEVASVTTTNNGGVWDYAYSMQLTAGNSLSATNANGTSQFIFYDLAGLTGPQASFTAGATSTADWSIMIENTSGAWANGQSSIISQGGTAVESDLASAPNVRFQYVGAGFSTSDSNSILGTAHLFSTLPPGLYGQFAARDVANTSGQTEVNTESPLLPTQGGGSGQPVAVPLPTALGSGLSLIASLAFLGRYRKHLRSSL